MDHDKKDTIYSVLRDTNLTLDVIRIIKSFMSKEDWTRKVDDYFDPYDHKFVNALKQRHRNKFFTYQFFGLYV